MRPPRVLLPSFVFLLLSPGRLPADTATRAATPATRAAAKASGRVLAPVQVVATGIEGFRTIPRHGYALGAQALNRAQSGNFPDLLADRLVGVSLTHEQGNALQPSLRFNGFAASPLLGTSQGLSAFEDGVRINEPFGDVVNWDLVPMNAIRSIDVIGITDPVFGLNSLGGAIVLRTLDGRSASGGDATLKLGSFGKSSEQLRYGGHRRNWSYFIAVRNQHERGYAPFTASGNRSLFAKLTRDTARVHDEFAYTFAQSRLAGSQTLPLDWMSTPTAIYTAPDTIENRLSFFNFGDVRVLTPHWQFGGRAYLRTSNQNGFNSNVNGNYAGATPTLADPGAYNGIDGLRQQNRGLNLALHEDHALAGRPDSASLGMSLSDQRIDYVQVQQPAAFDAQRYTIGVGPFDLAPVDLGVQNRYRGVYVSDRLDMTRSLDVTAGGRYQQAQIDMTDHLGGPLGGDHRYARFNPSVGIDLHPTPKASYYLRYAEGIRVPMPVELTCASPTAPCTLPNVLIADPGLRPVVARSAQGGAVWHAGDVRVHGEYTMTRLTDAIQFINLAHMTQGYFTNVPREVYRSASLDASGEAGRWSWVASVNRTEANYESSFEEPSPGNSSADASGDIQVRAGDVIPNIPAWTGKLRTQYRATPRLSLRTVIVIYGSRYPQGDENQGDAHGALPGYTVVNLGARYSLGRRWRFDLSIHNLFDRVYGDFGQLGVNEFTGPDRAFSRAPAGWRNTEFVAPGAPRGAWLSIDCRWP